MQIVVENVGPCRKRVRLVVPPERVKREIDDTLRNASMSIRLPGFRPGHVPRAVLEKKFGAAIRRDVKESLVNDGYRQALKDHNLSPLSSPKIDIEGLQLQSNGGLEVDFELDVRPEIQPEGYKGAAVTIAKPAVNEREIDEQIDQIRKLRRRPTKDEAAALERDGFAMASIEFREGDRAVLKRDNVRVMTTTPVVGADAGEFEKTITGKKAGESFEIAVEFPAEFEARDVAGKKGVACLTIREVYRLVAPTDEEMLRELDMPDLQTLRSDVSRRLMDAKAKAERRRAEDEILDRSLAETPIELPEHLLDDQMEGRLGRLRAHMEAQGATAEETAAELQKERARSRDDVAKGIRRFFLMEAIAKKEKLFVTEDDLVQELRSIAERNQSTVDEVRRYYEEQQLLPALRLDVLETKVRGFVYDSAKRNEI